MLRMRNSGADNCCINTIRIFFQKRIVNTNNEICIIIFSQRYLINNINNSEYFNIMYNKYSIDIHYIQFIKYMEYFHCLIDLNKINIEIYTRFDRKFSENYLFLYR